MRNLLFVLFLVLSFHHGRSNQRQVSHKLNGIVKMWFLKECVGHTAEEFVAVAVAAWFVAMVNIALAVDVISRI